LLTVFSSLAGAALVLITAWALGVVALWRRPAPFEIALALGAVVESLIVFLLLQFNVAQRGAFLAMAAVAAAAAWQLGW
jgi:hypothetical protein